MAVSEERINRLLLKDEIEQFLYQEAELLDERRFEEWLDFLTEDIRYWMPMRRNVKSGNWTGNSPGKVMTSTGSMKERTPWSAG